MTLFLDEQQPARVESASDHPAYAVCEIFAVDLEAMKCPSGKMPVIEPRYNAAESVVHGD